MVDEVIQRQQGQLASYRSAYTKETLSKELTEAGCYSRHSCSKLLLIDAICIWLSDRILFTLTTLINLENGVWCSKE